MIVRTGIGFDTHRLVEGRRCILGGVDIPHEKGLLGHSDADVLAHAIMDALLGAIAAGDIGHLFPDTDPLWAGADSLALLARVAALVRERGWEISNLDATVMAERPKLAPHIDAIRENLARAAAIPVGAVSVKATTLERMGSIGREEGIGAMAVATVCGQA
jgi:2-C-methyl-D-erythritol 2,4-cyclodiphosphate synthase